MDVLRMKAILKEEYGINSKEELEAAMQRFSGLDIGIFVSDIHPEALPQPEEVTARAV